MRKKVGGRPGQGNGPLSTRTNREEHPRLFLNNTPETALVNAPASPYREIRLTHGLVAIVDEPDFEMLSHWSWQADSNGYARHGYGNGNAVYMSRMLALPDPGMEVDHINGDGLDNRRCNLRVCTHRENLINRPTSAKSGYRGVQKQPRMNRGWLAQITTFGCTMYLGTFPSAESAARAYDRAAREVNGEFAVLNFPEVTR